MATLGEFLKTAFGIDTNKEMANVDAPTPAPTPETTPAPAPAPTPAPAPATPPTPAPMPGSWEDVQKMMQKLITENQTLKTANSQLAAGISVGQDSEKSLDDLLFGYFKGDDKNAESK